MCAECHNHPFEAITQTDYFGLAAYFARVQFKGSQFGLDDEIVYLAPGSGSASIPGRARRKNQSLLEARWDRWGPMKIAGNDLPTG